MATENGRNEYRKWQDSLSTSADADNVVHFIRARAKAHWHRSPLKNPVFVSYSPETLLFTVRMAFRPSSNEFFNFVDQMSKAFDQKPSALRMQCPDGEKHVFDIPRGKDNDTYSFGIKGAPRQLLEQIIVNAKDSEFTALATEFPWNTLVGDGRPRNR